MVEKGDLVCAGHMLEEEPLHFGIVDRLYVLVVRKLLFVGRYVGDGLEGIFVEMEI